MILLGEKDKQDLLEEGCFQGRRNVCAVWPEGKAGLELQGHEWET